MTLRALGDPADIIAMEGLIYEATIFSSFGAACDSVKTEIRGGNCTHEKAIAILNDTATSLQAMLDILNMEF